jgi:hypothetical protein
VRERTNLLGDGSGSYGTAQNVGDFNRQKVRSRKRAIQQLRLRPPPVRARVDEGRHYQRCVDDSGHLRSLSRRRKISFAESFPREAFLRSRTRSMRTATLGRRASSISSARKCSCRDLPADAARAASSSRTSSRHVANGHVGRHLHAFHRHCMHNAIRAALTRARFEKPGRTARHSPR